MEIELKIETERDINDVCNYIKEALEGWGGGYDIHHPFFGGLSKVSVRPKISGVDLSKDKDFTVIENPTAQDFEKYHKLDTEYLTKAGWSKVSKYEHSYSGYKLYFTNGEYAFVQKVKAMRF